MKMDDKTHQADGRKEASEEATVLAPQERDNFAGVTIEDARQNQDTKTQNRQYYRGSSGQRGYVRTVSFGSGSLGGLLGWLVLLGIVLFVLPTFFLLAAGVAVVWFILRLFR